MYNYFLFLYTGLFLHFLIHKKDKIVDYSMGNFYVPFTKLYQSCTEKVEVDYTLVTLS